MQHSVPDPSEFFAPDPSKFFAYRNEWERGEIPPGSVMSSRKTDGIPDLSEGRAAGESL